jgi:4-amino-4-deoxy-L-arabinose transferase-like glycosyltransferase
VEGEVSVQTLVGGEGDGRDGRVGEPAANQARAEPAGEPVSQEAPLNRRLQAGLWLLLAVFAFHGVFGHSLWGGNDCREGGMIWDMYRHNTWVTPTINGQPFLEKPPLLHWTALVFCHIAGRVTEGLVRLPAALYGFGTLVLIYLFVAGSGGSGEPAAATGSRQLAAWAAVFACGTAIEFHEYSRIVLTDMALTFMVTLSLFLFWRAWCRPGTGRWLVFVVAAAASFYGKGLIGPALIWSAVGVFLLWKRRFRLLAVLAAAYVPLLLAFVLPWGYALFKFAGGAAVKFAFWDNQIGRFFHFGDPTLPHDPFFINKEPPYYYLLHLPSYLAPWTLLFVPTFVAWWRRSSAFREQFHVFVTCALAGMFLVLHASSAKVVNYALPTYPFLFMMAGIWLVQAASHPRPAKFERWCVGLTAWGGGVLFSLVPVAFVVGMFARPDLFRIGDAATAAAKLLSAGLLLVLIVMLASALGRLGRSGARSLAFGLAPAAFAVGAIGVLQFVTPSIEWGRSLKPFARLAAEEVRRGRTVAFAGDLQSDIGAFTFYLDRRLAILKDGKDVVSYLSATEPRAVIAPAEKLPSMEVQLAGVPHTRLIAGDPGTLSRSFVLLVNHPGEEAAGAGTDPVGPDGKANQKVATER